MKDKTIQTLAERHLRRNFDVNEEVEVMPLDATFDTTRQMMRQHVACFLWDLLREVSGSEGAATTEGIRSIVEVAAELRRYLRD